MARRRKKRAVTAWNRKFGATAKACFAGQPSMKSFGKCMRDNLKKSRKKRR